MTPKTVIACVFAPLLLQLLSSACPAAIILVPLQRPTIQAAIDSAAAGDVVLVYPGTYFENIDFKGKAITLRAVHILRPVIIDGQWKGPVVMFHNGELATSVLYGFTIQHGFAGAVAPCYYEGGGVCVLHASPTIRHNTIINNIAEAGNGIAVEFGAPLIVDNYIANNIEDGTGGIGGGIFLYGTTTAQIIDNVIENNRCDFGGGIGMYNGGRPTITGNILRGNQAAEGGGVWIANGTDAYIGQNLFTGNSSYNGAAVNWTVPQGDRGPILVNNTIADNIGQAIYASGFDRNTPMTNNIVTAGAGQTALYCDPYDNYPPNMHDNDVYSAGGLAYDGYCTNQTHHQGNISSDPLFVSAASGDYHLQALSPAIDTGSNAAPRLAATDFDGAARIQDGNLDGTSTVDMGIFEYTPGKTTSSIAATVQQESSKASRTDMAHPSLRRYESVDRDNRRTVRYYDATGRLIAEVDANGVFHRAH